MKRTLAVGLTLVLVLFAFAGCGGASLSGRYGLTSISLDGTDMTALLELGGVTTDDIYIEFKSGSKFTMAAPAGDDGSVEEANGTYKLDGSELKLTVDGDTIAATIENDTITLENDGMALVFKKS